jgi:hypothetical protein
MQWLLRHADWDTREVRDDVRDYATGHLGDPVGEPAFEVAHRFPEGLPRSNVRAFYVPTPQMGK